MPERKESTVMLSNIRPKKPFRSPAANHWYRGDDVVMGMKESGKSGNRGMQGTAGNVRRNPDIVTGK
jgi:hypothetical protein